MKQPSSTAPQPPPPPPVIEPSEFRLSTNYDALYRGNAEGAGNPLQVTFISMEDGNTRAQVQWGVHIYLAKVSRTSPYFEFGAADMKSQVV